MQDIFVRIEGIAGESQDAAHKGWIDALSFSYDVTQYAAAAFGGGLGVGRADFGALSFTHYVDRATPVLFQYCASGKHIPKVELSACKSGGGAQEYLRITLTDAVITRAGPGGSAGDDLAKEVVEIIYSQIKIEVREQQSSGSMKATVTGTWNLKENKP